MLINLFCWTEILPLNTEFLFYLELQKLVFFSIVVGVTAVEFNSISPFFIAGLLQNTERFSFILSMSTCRELSPSSKPESSTTTTRMECDQGFNYHNVDSFGFTFKDGQRKAKNLMFTSDCFENVTLQRLEIEQKRPTNTLMFSL